MFLVEYPSYSCFRVKITTGLYNIVENVDDKNLIHTISRIIIIIIILIECLLKILFKLKLVKGK